MFYKLYNTWYYCPHSIRYTKTKILRQLGVDNVKNETYWTKINSITYRLTIKKHGYLDPTINIIRGKIVHTIDIIIY